MMVCKLTESKFLLTGKNPLFNREKSPFLIALQIGY
jgi:hypothetical protein